MSIYNIKVFNFKLYAIMIIMINIKNFKKEKTKKNT